MILAGGCLSPGDSCGGSPGDFRGGGGGSARDWGISLGDWGISPGVFFGGYPLVIGGLSPGDSGWWYPLVGGGGGGGGSPGDQELVLHSLVTQV